MATKDMRKPFFEIVQESASKFGARTSLTLESMYGAPVAIGQTQMHQAGMCGDRDFYVSIMFTGLVYGEYFLAMKESTAKKILGGLASRQTIAESFSAVLKTIVGPSIAELTDCFEMLTITPPRCVFGTLFYPKVSMAKVTLVTSQGPIDCCFFIDSMNLGIASLDEEVLQKQIIKKAA